MNDEQLHILADLQAFRDGTVPADFAWQTRRTTTTLLAPRSASGMVASSEPRRAGHGAFFGEGGGRRVSGYSRQQLSPLAKRGCELRRLAKRYLASRTSFVRTCTKADVLRLAAPDTMHSTMSGLAIKKLMERAYRAFGDARY